MFYIDKFSEIPIYTQIRNGIIKEIANGNLKVGDELPSVRQFAQDFGINPMTVNKAYNILKAEGIIEIDRRKGSVIFIKNDENVLKRITSDFEILIDELKARNLGKEFLMELIERSFKWYFQLF